MKKLIITFFALMATVTGVALGADAKAGADLFNTKCKGCHGEGGAAPNDMMSKMLGAPIPALTSPEIQAKSDADLKTIVTAGKGKMPAAMKTATPAQVDDVIAYVRTLKK
jgi:mono/diheme cytochrome c family protein